LGDSPNDRTDRCQHVPPDRTNPRLSRGS
jgi:hypothetical protein